MVKETMEEKTIYLVEKLLGDEKTSELYQGSEIDEARKVMDNVGDYLVRIYTKEEEYLRIKTKLYSRGKVVDTDDKVLHPQDLKILEELLN